MRCERNGFWDQNESENRMDLSAILTPAQREVLKELHERDADERRRGERTPASAMALAPAVAELLYALVIQRRAQRTAELGTSLGYSTIHLAAAASRHGGHVFSVDCLPEKTELAQGHIERAGLAHCVTLATGDGAEWIASLPSDLDLALIDYRPDALTNSLGALLERMAPTGILFVDGGPEGYWTQAAPAQFLSRLQSDPEWLVSMIPMHKVQLLAVRL